MSAGETPLMRLACPIVVGLTWLSFTFASLDNALILYSRNSLIVSLLQVATFYPQVPFPFYVALIFQFYFSTFQDLLVIY